MLVAGLSRKLGQFAPLVELPKIPQSLPLCVGEVIEQPFGRCGVALPIVCCAVAMSGWPGCIKALARIHVVPLPISSR